MREYRFPPFSARRCANGLEVLHVPDAEQPAAVVALQLPRGRFADPPGREGAAELALALLQKGTAALAAEEFAERMERTGSQLFSEVGEEHVVVGCRFLSRYGESVVPLFHDMVRRPGMRRSEFKRLRRELLTALEAERIEPSTLAAKHFHAVLFGRAHPAGRFPTIESARRLRLADAVAAWQRLAGPLGAVLVVGGDVDAGRAVAWARPFEDWTGSGATLDIQAPAAGAGECVRLVDKSGLTQTSLVMGHVVPGELGERRLELLLANYILGGGNFSSRLMKRIRAASGRTYGISSQISRCRRFGTLTIATTTLNAHVRETVDLVLSEYRRTREEGVSAEELEAARQFIVGNMAFQLEGIGNVVEKLLWLRLYGRDVAYVEHFADAVGALTLEQVNAAIREYFQAGGLTLAAVGPAREVRSQLAGLGPVRQVGLRDAIR